MHIASELSVVSNITSHWSPSTNPQNTEFSFLRECIFQELDFARWSISATIF